MQSVEFELKSILNGSILIVWLGGKLSAEDGMQLQRLKDEISKQDIQHVLLDLSRLTHVGAGIMPAVERIARETLIGGVEVHLCLLPGDLKNRLAELAKSSQFNGTPRKAA